MKILSTGTEHYNGSGLEPLPVAAGHEYSGPDARLRRERAELRG
jgi:hypothetical protein